MFLMWMHMDCPSDGHFLCMFLVKLLHLHGFETVVEDEYGCEAEEEPLFLEK